MKFIAWMLFTTLLVTGCSRTRTAKSVSNDTPQIELSDTDEFNEADPLAEDSALSLSTEPETLDAAPVVSTEAKPAKTVALGDGEAEYTVQKNETLMMIAFKLYGDYGMWRELANRNTSQLKGKSVRAGMRLTYRVPAVAFEWNPQGNPYLIRTGDTLGGISGSVYGTTKKWKSIWENNRPLIKDPNRIFAGFTIYWLEQGQMAKAEAGSYEL